MSDDFRRYILSWRVSLNNIKSNGLAIVCGVAQGLVLGDTNKIND